MEFSANSLVPYLLNCLGSLINRLGFLLHYHCTESDICKTYVSEDERDLAEKNKVWKSSSLILIVVRTHTTSWCQEMTLCSGVY